MAWDATSRGKLTRKARAELLGVSERTVDNIFARKRVDRATLQLVFRSIGMEWESRFAEEHPHIEQSPLPIQAPKQVRWELVAIGVVLFTAIAGAVWRPWRRSFPPEVSAAPWAVRSDRLFDEGMTAYHRGEYKLASQKLNELAQIAEQNQDGGRLASAYRGMGDLEAERGDLDGAKLLYEKSLKLRQLLKDSHSEPALHEALGGIATRAKDFHAAQLHYLAALKGFRSINIPAGIAEAQRGLGTVSYLKGEDTESLAWYASAKATLEGHERSAMFVDLRAREAMVLNRQGKSADAERILKQCLDFWVSEKHARWIARTKLQLAQVAADREDRDRAKDLIRESKESFSKLGDRAGQEEAEYLMYSISLAKRGKS